MTSTYVGAAAVFSSAISLTRKLLSDALTNNPEAVAGILRYAKNDYLSSLERSMSMINASQFYSKVLRDMFLAFIAQAERTLSLTDAEASSANSSPGLTAKVRLQRLELEAADRIQAVAQIAHYYTDVATRFEVLSAMTKAYILKYPWRRNRCYKSYAGKRLRMRIPLIIFPSTLELTVYHSPDKLLRVSDECADGSPNALISSSLLSSFLSERTKKKIAEFATIAFGDGFRVRNFNS